MSSKLTLGSKTTGSVVVLPLDEEEADLPSQPTDEEECPSDPDSVPEPEHQLLQCLSSLLSKRLYSVSPSFLMCISNGSMFSIISKLI